MKKTFKLLTLLASAAVLLALGVTSCKKVEEEQVKEPVKVTGVSLNVNSKTVTEGEEFTLVATVAPKDADEKAVTWSSSDDKTVSISQEGKAKALKPGTATITVTTKDGGKTATCEVTVEARYVAVESVAITPASGAIAITLEETPTLQLAATVLPEDATDKAVTWTSDKTEIATVDENGKVTPKAAGTVTITATVGEKTATCPVEVSFNIPFVGKFAVTGTRIYGGTGPQYGGAALVDPTKKASVWSTNGSGPEAYNDDYLEFTVAGFNEQGAISGKCVHYGGADGKEWNCTFLGVYNNVDPGYDKDCHEAFCQIPLGESIWVYNKENNAIVFVDKNSKQTYGQFLVAGSYPFKNDSNNTALTVEEGKYAFGFACKGTDDWKATYTNFDMLAGNVHNFFYLVDKVDAIPEASAVTGVEVAEAGQAVMQPANALGDWAVTNMWVVGGAQDCYTMDRVEEKTWCWNNYSCNKELNNLLTIKADGTAKYDGLANGYWDYMYAGYNGDVKVDPMIDCSAWYNQIPHGDFTFTFKPETGEAVLGTGDNAPVAKLMTPGSYSFWGIKLSNSTEFKKLTIADNQMGVRFVLAKKPSTDKTYIWKDYDRFVNSPLVYIIVFTKQ